MTENEAIKKLNMLDEALNFQRADADESSCALQIAIQALEEIQQYRDAKEQGLLLRLPCKVGDTVYCIFSKRTKCAEHNQEFDEYNCQGCECLECDSRKEKYVQEMKAYRLDWIVDNLDRFGKTVFLTKEEAEQALKQMGE